jgi:hypothetical protein
MTMHSLEDLSVGQKIGAGRRKVGARERGADGGRASRRMSDYASLQIVRASGN